ncbi:beta-1,4-galactosyltransferase [Virgibacillus profundi]|uniref:Beta-1,4-galactosyltransferase n=1 Tax=Virgibacillus profundi TaxID=2024555 RepID=A0A2A2IIU1_9BACI|nr:glycosyltransferase family 2 protein [Virgibacillus profundi]PAV31547.1 beta-1,4-galactosyltransferase [Virgibacillus profundi]PXY55733.1 beta-1,4-galactosyltransferase [Virgibacillus profundi]
MFQKGKVSVVVPIYKVEKYIHRCVDSILNQTYKNIEVILVDDGSPDHCGKIADQYRDKDDRIKVIHKENGGLSDARNHGMKQVTGEYTMFADSDDWLKENAIELMLHYSLRYQADVVQSAFYYAYEDKLLIDNRYIDANDEPLELDNQILMYELVKNEKVKNFAWGKLYKTELIKEIPFKKGVLFEDVFWAHQVMHNVKNFLLMHQPLYYYFQRDDSIVATYSPRNLDIIKGLKVRHQFIEKNYERLIDASYIAILKMCLIHYNLLFMNRKKDKNGIYRKEIQSYIQTNYTKLKNAVKYDKQLNTQLYLFSLHPYFNIAFLGLRRGLRSIRVLSHPPGLEQVEVNLKKEVLAE